MKMLLLVLLLLWNDKEGAHATQGKKTYCFRRYAIFSSLSQKIVTDVMKEEESLYEKNEN